MNKITDKVVYLSTLHELMKLIWIWPSNEYDYLYIYKATIYMVLLNYYLLGVTIYAIAAVKDPEATSSEKLEGVSVAMAVIALEYEYIACFFLRRRLSALFAVLEHFDNFGVPSNITEVNKTMNKLCRALFVYSCLTSLSAFEAILNQKTCEDKRHSKHKLCGFATVLTYPYDISDGFLYYFHITLQLYCYWMLLTCGLTISGMAFVVLEFIIVRIDHFKALMMDLFKDGNPDRVKLRVYIQYQVLIIRLVREFNNFAKVTTAPAMFIYSAVLGLTFVALFKDPNLKTALYLGGWLLGIYSACYAGERLIERSSSISTLLYDLEWYSADISTQKDVLFMMMRAQKLLVFECGPLTEFSLPTMRKIMQGAYTYKTFTSTLDA